MSKYLLVLLLIASPAVAQVKPAPKTSAAHSDPCAPIGRTADGKLVYSMKCENLPAPPAPPPQALKSRRRRQPAAAPEPEILSSGIFGWSYERKRPDPVSNPGAVNWNIPCFEFGYILPPSISITDHR